jgi:hypothetical protein
VEVDVGTLVGGEAGQQRWVAGQPAMDPAAHLPSQARQRPMWPPQALRVPSGAPRDEAGPLQAGLHPGVAQLDPLRLPQPFMAVPHIGIEGLLLVEPYALCVTGQGQVQHTGLVRAAVEQTVIVLALRAWFPAAQRAR